MLDQKKIGNFLKELRKEKNLTQEQLAEILNVSGRTVSRWETGTNMPDLSILVEIAEFYNVDMKEIIQGERISGKTNEELKETVEQIVEYSEAKETDLKKKMANMSFFAAFMIVFALVVNLANKLGYIADQPTKNVIFEATEIALVSLILQTLYLTGKLESIVKWMKSKIINRK